MLSVLVEYSLGTNSVQDSMGNSSEGNREVQVGHVTGAAVAVVKDAELWGAEWCPAPSRPSPLPLFFISQ
jgi:hypothetical protein